MVRSKKGKAGETKRLLQLTDKGKSLIAQIEPVGQIMIAALTEVVATKNKLKQAIDEVEAQLNRQSFL